MSSPLVGLDAERWPAPSWLARLRRLLLENRKLTTATFVGIFANLYENRPAFFLDRPIEYDFFRGAEISFRTLARFTNRVGNWLRSLGVARGDRIGLATRNRIEMAFVELGAQKIGAVPVPINSLLRAAEIQQIMEDAGCRVLVTDRAVFEENIKDTRRVPSIETWAAVSRQPIPGLESFARGVETASEELEPIAIADSDLAVIFYTAGTTGKPKGAMLSCGALMFGVRHYAKIRAVMPFAPRDLSLLVMPLAHTSGHQALLLNLAIATPAYLMGRFDAAKILELIAKLRVTTFSGIPTMYRMLLEAGAEQADLSSIQYFGGGADAFSDDLITKFLSLADRGKRGRKQARFIRGYGLTETGGQLSQAQPGPLGHGCIGKPISGVSFEIWDEAMRPVPDGEVGELVARTPGLMKGYWNNSAMTEEAFRGGWFHTGDLARKGDGGNYFIAARKKEMIKVGGYSVFPAEVETEMMAHPAVERVAVVGLPHEMKGERPVAAVVRKPGATVTAEDLLAWSREHIAPYKCPRQVFLVDGLPMSSAMKVKRGEVRELLLGDGGAQVRASAGR
jgi:long-chain acyl-CoA synthetase